MVRKYSEPLEEHGNFLIPVPGGNDGPSGVLVCSENYITYKNFGDQADIRMPIPRRKVCTLHRSYIFVMSEACHKNYMLLVIYDPQKSNFRYCNYSVIIVRTIHVSKKNFSGAI